MLFLVTPVVGALLGVVLIQRRWSRTWTAMALPFLVLTGYPCGDFEEPVLRDVPCLAKPYSEAELQAVIDRLLGR